MASLNHILLNLLIVCPMQGQEGKLCTDRVAVQMNTYHWIRSNVIEQRRGATNASLPARNASMSSEEKDVAWHSESHVTGCNTCILKPISPEAEVGDLSRRLESIEQRLENTESISPSISHSIADSSRNESISADVLTGSTPDSPPLPENGTACKLLLYNHLHYTH
jgi:hypothetical protein